MLKVNITIFFLFSVVLSYSQQLISIEKSFNWHEETYVDDFVTESNASRISFDDAGFSSEHPLKPICSHRFELPQNGKLKVEIEEMTFLDESPYNKLNKLDYEAQLSKSLDKKIVFSNSVDQNRNKFYGKIFFSPVIYINGELRYIKSIKFNAYYSSTPFVLTKTPPVTQSIFSEGKIYKLKIPKEGMYKITGTWLKEKLGISLSSINPSMIQIFSNTGGKLPFAVKEERPDDVFELAIDIIGIEDGEMNENDAIFFYAEGAEKWTYSVGEEFLKYKDNPFDVDNYAFIRFDIEEGKRVLLKGENVDDIVSITTFLASDRYENNQVNLLEQKFGTIGTGQQWFGEHFDINLVQDFSTKLSIDHVDKNNPALFKFQFAGRCQNTSSIVAKVNEESFSSSISSTSLGSYTSNYARNSNFEGEFQLSNSNPTIIFDYSANNGGEGWLDYFEIQYQRNLILDESPLTFNNLSSTSNSQYNMFISNSNTNHKVWNITNLNNAFSQKIGIKNNGTYFTLSTEDYQKFIIYDFTQSLLSPEFVSEIENQNLHGIQNTEMIILTHSSLRAEAEKLANHRTEHDGTTIEIINIDKVYNEFSNGRWEPTAIRDFFKMVYDRDPAFKFGLLLGNGSYDYKGIKLDRDKYNMIPVFETTKSLNAVSTFPSDDFFGLLSEGDGNNLKGEVELAIGRLPVSNSVQANMVIDKIIKYDTDPTIRGPWNLLSVFAADDEDRNLHINPADEISETILINEADINVKKIFFDAYPQISTPGGERYPSVTDDINRTVYKGALSFCYLGHGGPTGWAQERVLQIGDIDGWSNTKSFPLFVTATCSLSSYDDPEVFSAGEKILVNKNGGIALFTTSRAVYASDNTRLTKSVFHFMHAVENGKPMQIGEILRRAKNNSDQDTLDVNARKFLLLGDPSMRLLYPMNEIITTSINDVDLSQTSFTDTIQALSEMSIAGFIAKDGVKINDYDGVIDVTVFDKRTNRKTLQQDPKSKAKEFLQQTNIIFKGKAKVTSGEFAFSFVVPKDILFNVGNGKISYYASDGIRDARGHYDQFLIGGSSNNPIVDDVPPIVEVFMNNENFVFGGLTNENPLLYAKITDNIGINLSGASVGHDLTGTLDEDAQQSYFLNDFYETELNDFSKGIIQYPLNKLSNGKHKISVRAWDVANNVGEGFTEFIVSDHAGEGLAHVLNYPNPFTDNTCFMFEHNLAPDILDVQINIYTVSGKLVKTIEHNTISDGYRINDIKWDGNDDFGSPLAKGVYLYKIKIKAQQQGIQKESDYEKLVILK